jgi:hypothetical protein
MLDQTDFTLEQMRMKVKYHISNTSGRWMINGKRYKDLNAHEKQFFDDFIKATKLKADKSNL